jgi:hypothetical protein
MLSHPALINFLKLATACMGTNGNYEAFTSSVLGPSILPSTLFLNIVPHMCLSAEARLTVWQDTPLMEQALPTPERLVRFRYHSRFLLSASQLVCFLSAMAYLNHFSLSSSICISLCFVTPRYKKWLSISWFLFSFYELSKLLKLLCPLQTVSKVCVKIDHKANLCKSWMLGACTSKRTTFSVVPEDNAELISQILC